MQITKLLTGGNSVSQLAKYNQIAVIGQSLNGNLKVALVNFDQVFDAGFEVFVSKPFMREGYFILDPTPEQERARKEILNTAIWHGLTETGQMGGGDFIPNIPAFAVFDFTRYLKTEFSNLF